MEQRKIKSEIVFANVLLCLLVVFIHVSGNPVSSLEKDSLAYISVMFPWRLSAFVVQGFIFLASFKIFIKNEITDYKAYYVSRIKTIVIPYIFWVVIYYLGFCWVGYFPFDIKALIQYIFIGNIVSPFYFIIIIIQFYALMPLWQKVYRKISPFWTVIISLIITFIFKEYLVKAIEILTNGYSFGYNDRIFTSYLIFWTLGAVCGLNYKAFTEFLKKQIHGILCIFAILAALDLFFSYKAFVLCKAVPFLEYLHLFYCIAAILAVMAIGLFVKSNKFLKEINGITFNIYLSHCFIMFIVDHLISKVGITGIAKSYAIRFVAVYAITISLCLIYKNVKNHLPKKVTVLK